MGTKGTRYPLDRAALFHNRALGVQIVHIFRPVLDRRIAEFRIFADVQLDTARMQVCYVIFRRRTALDEMQICPLINDDQSMFKLSGSRCIETKIGLERDRNRHALWHVHKRSAGPDRPVQRCKFMFLRFDQMHKMCPDHFRIFAVHCALQIGVDNALRRYLRAHVMIY